MYVPTGKTDATDVEINRSTRLSKVVVAKLG